MTDIQGYCNPKFERVADAFAKNFAENQEVGASIAATVEGEMVVDLWGGFADQKTSRLWEKNSICCVFSATKGVVATVTHMLVERGQIDLDLPIAHYWPEYAQNGKENVTLRQVMAHTAGMVFIDTELYIGAPYDWETMVNACAAQKPEWEPGSTLGYHAITFGWIVGEVMRRVTGEMPGSLVAKEIAETLQAEFFIGLLESQDQIVAPLIPLPKPNAPQKSADQEPAPQTYGQRSMSMFFKNVPSGIDPNNSRDFRGAQLPATGGHTNARGLATIYRPLANGGAHAGTQLLKQSTIDEAIVMQASGPDIVLGVDVNNATGYKLMQSDFGEYLGSRTFGHPGFGGSSAFADPDNHVSFAYVMNKLWEGPRGSDPRKKLLAAALYDCIG